MRVVNPFEIVNFDKIANIEQKYYCCRTSCEITTFGNNYFKDVYQCEKSSRSLKPKSV